MWPFTKKDAVTKKDPDETQTERLERLERAMRRLEEEWTEVYHKFRVLQMRTAKQVQRLQSSSPEEETTQPAAGDGLHAVPPNNESPPLTARQMQLQAQILSRRKGA